MDNLYYKWHHSEHDLPKPYKPILVATREGRMVKGFVTITNRFSPECVDDVKGLSEIVMTKWRYLNP